MRAQRAPSCVLHDRLSTHFLFVLKFCAKRPLKRESLSQKTIHKDPLMQYILFRHSENAEIFF